MRSPPPCTIGVSPADAAAGVSLAELTQPPATLAQNRGQTPIMVRARPKSQADRTELVAHQGEIIGLAGSRAMARPSCCSTSSTPRPRNATRHHVAAPVALVAGDRQTDGVFPLWSIAENIGIRSLAAAAARPADFAGRARPQLAERLEAAHRHPHARPAATPSCRSRAATSRRRCSPARSARTRASC